MGRRQRVAFQDVEEESSESSDANLLPNTGEATGDTPNGERRSPPQQSVEQQQHDDPATNQRDWLTERLAKAEGALLMQSQNERKMELALVKEAARTKALQRKLEAAQNAADATAKVGEKMTESNAFYIEKLSEGQEAQIAFLNER